MSSNARRAKTIRKKTFEHGNEACEWTSWTKGWVFMLLYHRFVVAYIIRICFASRPNMYNCITFSKFVPLGVKGAARGTAVVLLLWCRAYTTIFSPIHLRRSRILLIRMRTHNNNNDSAAVTTVPTHLHTASESKIFCIQSHAYHREFNTDFAAVCMLSP